MIISPPFLPAPIAGESDEAFLDRAMVGGIPGDGGFPLSFDLNWHGGIHLTAPQEAGAPPTGKGHRRRHSCLFQETHRRIQQPGTPIALHGWLDR